MSEFDEKLGAILGDQNAMSQIMALAQSLSGTGENLPEGACCEGGAPFPQPRQDEQLLAALRPYLKEHRQKKLDRMLEMLRLLRMLRGSRE